MRKIVFKSLFLLVLTILLSACTTRPPLVKSTTINEYKKPGMALIVGSLVVQNGRLGYDKWSIQLRSVNKGSTFKSDIKGSRDRQVPGGHDFDFSNKQYSGNMFAMVVPAGSYEYYSYSLFKNHGMSYSTWTPKTEFSLPFKVEENKINYIGEIAAHTGTGENAFGMSITSSGTWSVGDAIHRDLSLLKKHYPNVEWGTLIPSIPKHSNQPEIVIVNKDNKHLFATSIHRDADYLKNLVKEIQKGSLERNRNISRQIVKERLFNEPVLDALQEQIEKNYQLKQDGGASIDSLAWMCKALAMSKNTKYQSVVQKVSEDAHSKKVRQYASGYLTHFN
ncbi:hypothetical protein A9Q99_15465 [Gammaproteobacteria bacterium 45_16_T64]|nr:hypothetical protein A9Q99_15465 [Gammaproteobacteria bacterium 45_16_T64]